MRWSNQSEEAMKFKQRKDGEGFSVKSGELHRIACCDCGLVHDFVFISKGKHVGIAARRNKKLTKKLRKKIKE
jgi:hypothetical protein